MAHTKPFPYQEVGVRLITDVFGGRALLGDDMGLGKTLQFLLFAVRNRDTFPAVVVCPASLKWNWEREALTHVGLKSEILEGRKAPRVAPQNSKRLWIVNYDILHNWLEFLQNLGPRLVGLDEAHYLKSPDARRTKTARLFCKPVPHVIAMTGTPVVNRPIDLWPVLNIIRPDKFPSRMAFAMRYCAPRRTHWGWDLTGSARTEELNRKLREYCMVRRTKEEVLKDLPPKRTQVVTLDIERRDEYAKAEREFINWLLTRYGRGKATAAMRAERLVQMGYLKRLAAELKMGGVLSWIKEFLASGEKLVVFAVHKKIVSLIASEFPSVVVSGAVVGKSREYAFQKFKTDPMVRVFVGNIDAAGVGWSCDVSSTVCFAEMTWTPGKHTQAEDRVRGVGRGLKGVMSSAVYLVAHGTIEERLCEVVQKKSDVIGKVLDGKKASVVSVFDILTEEMKKEGKAPKTTAPRR